ncbi:adenomatous polyposis coli protein-like isoform X2 [Scleropages formosus]|uniref:adenomatous polyposis coli protein-like isoform X2 n=1 Tax=Scleropages formosus TaxID=113540 RepID=UPI0010FA96BA|nr:adenomatous polyposis coli protein-like isoform X2 [Scleropages formosus]
MATASYDQLLKQVEALKMENSNLRQELEDNSNHLTKLETEALNMKEVLKQLQGSIEEESLGTSGPQIDLLERLKEMNLDGSSFSSVKLRPKASLRSYGSREGSVSSRSGDSSPVASGSIPRRGAVKAANGSTAYLDELEKERSLLMAELEKEEKEKDWYYTQLQNLTKRIDSLPLTENTDMSRRQLEYEARQIRAAMENQLGSCQDMERRAQARLARIQQIEKEMLRIRQSESVELDKAMQSKREPASRDCERQSEGGQPSSDPGTTAQAYGQASGVRMDHETTSDTSFSGSYSVPRRLTSHLGTKVEMVYSLLSMLGTHDKDDMSRTLLAMSSSQDSCIAMRQSGCLPLLIQLLHGNDKDSVLLGNSRGSKEARARASAALHNIIHSQPDDKRGRREIRVLHLLEQIRAYCETCWTWQEAHAQGVDQEKNPMPSPVEHQICPAVCVLMKLSFDEEHRHAMNQLGGLSAIGELLQVDCEIYGISSDHYSVTLRRYAGMALTNLTFGDVANKATLCSMKGCMRAMVAQLKSESEDLQQVVASVLRNLSWRADVNSKQTLREVGSVKALMECALVVKKESTLKSVLSALWNLSAHCTENKAEICDVDRALAFLVGTLTYRSQTNTLAIIESGGGILRNISSLIATNEDHRQILRENNCLQTLLQHLKSHSLTIVSNACGTLWNLSARNAKDQEALWDMGAVSMLKNLIHSKHKMIAMGSAAALRNLMANRPARYKDANIMSPGSSLPSLHVRKQKALIEELDAQQLSETFDNIDNLSPKALHRRKPRCHNSDGVCRPEGFSPSNVIAISPFMNTSALAGSVSRDGRGSSESSKVERDRSLDRERRAGGPDTFHHLDKASQRLQMSLTAAQIAKVMEEVHSIQKGQDARIVANTPDTHLSTAQAHSNAYNFNKTELYSRTTATAKVEYRASSDSLHSVGSSDGYGKRGQMKPSVDSYSEEEGKCCVYRKYPADLAHKIHSANHMDDNDGDLDTPINYSLKYSDEQLNSGRQSPSQNEKWTRPRHLDGDTKRLDQQSQNPGYLSYTESKSDEDKRIKYSPRFIQSECAGFRSKSSTSSEPSQGSSSQGINRKINQTMCAVDDYEDDKPTNYSERYSEEEQPDEDQPMNYSIKYSEEHHHMEQPIDYSLKYSDAPSSQKVMFSHSKSPSLQSSSKDHMNLGSNTSSLTSLKNSCRQKQLHSSVQSQSGSNRVNQKTSTSKVSPINQETLQTYCVEDTPICFSRGSSLSSLSSAEDEMDEPESSSNVASCYSTLPITEKKTSGILVADPPTSTSQSSSPYIRVKPRRNQGSNLAASDGSRHKPSEISSGAKSPSKSGAQTPKSPPEHYVQETPLMFSRCTSVSSLESFESHSIASSVQSEPCSGMVSGIISPSDLPDSPGQTMPPSRSKTPPPQIPPQTKPRVKVTHRPEKKDSGPRHATVNAGIQKVQELPNNDVMLHFATESTPDGFSCASSLSALSLDEPFIQKDAELRLMPPVHEDDDGGNDIQLDGDTTDTSNHDKPSVYTEPEKNILVNSDDDDSEILEACIYSAMPTKSSRKPKKPSPSITSRIPQPVTCKPSQLPVYKPRSSQNRVQQKQTGFSHVEDIPKVFCVEGTPINFSTATSLSDLTIESPPNELSNTETSVLGAELFSIQTNSVSKVRSTEGKDASQSLTTHKSALDDKNEDGDDILAECISSAMPKGKSHRPLKVRKIIDRVQHPSTSSGNQIKQELERKPTSPVKPMPQTRECTEGAKGQSPSNSFPLDTPYSEKNKCPKKPDVKMASREIHNKPSGGNGKAHPSFAFDSPHHYTPIEGTPYCFSRNDSLSSLDFEDDDLDLSKEKAELRKGRESMKSKNVTERSSSYPASNRLQMYQKTSSKAPLKPTSYLEAPKDSTCTVPDEKQKFAIEDTPVCFSRNSSLSSLSDIDQENNNKPTNLKESQGVVTRPPASGYAPKAFHVEDTPVCFSRNSSLSSLSIDSEDDLLQECISSAMPKKKRLHRKEGEDRETSKDKGMTGMLLDDTDLPLDLADIDSPISEQALSPDSDSFDWKAIQEGANSVVSSLNQVAACLSRQGSSDTDSVLSLKSGISVVSPFHLTPDQEEKPLASNKGPRILKSGESSTSEARKREEEQAKSIKGGKKVYKSLITGKPRTSIDSVSSQQRQVSVPVVPRGRTTIHNPGVRNKSPSMSPVPQKMTPKGTATSFTQGQNSSKPPQSTKEPLKPDPVQSIGQQISQAGSSKASSRSSSRDSTPSRPAQQPLQSGKPVKSCSRPSLSPGRKNTKLSQIPRAVSPNTAPSKSPGSNRILYTSPGKQLNQTTSAKPSGLPRSTSGIPKSESASKGLNQPEAVEKSKKSELLRMSSTKSSGSESDRSEKPGLVRQSTFIKEAPSPTLKRKLEESASLESLSSSSRPVSPTRSQSYSVSSPSLQDVSPSSPPVVNCWRKAPQSQNPSKNADAKPSKHESSRSQSESPSRLPMNRSGTWKRETGKHSTSLPRVNTWKRTGSSSSILSASSESSEKAKSEDERLILSPVQISKPDKGGQPSLKGTWRKMREKKTSDSTNSKSHGLSDNDSPSTPQMAPPVYKTEDVWVRIEDCPINNPRSGKSSVSTPQLITDRVTDKTTAANADPSEMRSEHSAVLETSCNLNLLARANGEKKVGNQEVKSLGHPCAVTETREISAVDRTPFGSSSSSKQGSPSGAVSARVTPFNYKPTPRKCGADGLAARPSQIPTPVSSNAKKSGSKEDIVEPSSNENPKQISGSYLVTSV